MSKKSITATINRYVTITYPKLNLSDFVLGDAPYNRRCHLNAVQKVKEGKATKVLLVYAIDDDGYTCVHFINQLDDGKYQDNTWGWMYALSSYYVIREVSPSEYNKIWITLNNTKKMLVELNSSWLHRFVYRVKIDALI